MQFSKDFMWGAASASYQIEGGSSADGKGSSIWDTFSHTAGNTFNNQTGDIACDAYHLFETDLNLLKDFNIKHYRFSISWPRIFPSGKGKVNELGLDYYDRLIDGCISRGIEPWITLYHWDLPQHLQDIGGWENRETAYAFAEYAGFIALHFKDRVSRFITINEPQCIVGLGLGSGIPAPGLHLSSQKMFLAWHHIMLAHGLACHTIRAHIPNAFIGVASTGNLFYPNEKLAKIPEEAIIESFYSPMSPENPDWIFNHQWFLDPICFGHYPDDPNAPWTSYIENISSDDMALISQPLDFIALNIYNGHEMHLDENGTYHVIEKYPGYPRTALKWPITPEVLYWGPRLIYDRYHLPLIISENGLSCNDKIYLDGKIHDLDRIDFLHRYLMELRSACTEGIPVLAYFHWAFTDNYEWHSGYEERFGLIYIDYRNQKRIPKDSAYWYQKTILENGCNL